MTTQYQQPDDVTGTPRWGLARDIVAQLRAMPAVTAESETEVRLYNILGFLFPGLGYPDLATQFPSGDGPIDVYCRNAVFETKRPGRKDDARTKRDGSTETPEEQAVRYLDALTAQPNMFDQSGAGWRAGITDGKEWSFYDYRRDAPEGAKLTPRHTLRLDAPEDDEALLAYLYDFVNRTVKMTPPTDNEQWAESLVQPFQELAARYESSPEYEVKRSLWRGVLRGAFLNPQGDADAERDLFARHTMLVVTARAVAETLHPAGASAADAVRDRLTQGFAAWLLDAAGDDGIAAIDALVREVNKYAWSAANRDTLKDLYHAVIPRNIRHDFGEYYTPDWLARAVCEEVMDADWRKETIAMAAAGQLAGPAVLDPSCGSGTFLYHATQLLLEDAARHPELVNSPQAQVEIVSDLVAGMDLHPVAVELSKTTRMLAFGDLAPHYARLSDGDTIYLGDSLQWETRRSRASIAFADLVEIPGDNPDNPLRLPSSLLLQERFPQLLAHIFNYANRSETGDTEATLLAVLNLPNQADRDAVAAVYRRIREYIASGRNNVWQWYIANLIQPLRLANMPVSRIVGNPPWVAYKAMDNACPKCGGSVVDPGCEHAPGRQDTFRQHAAERGLWAGAHLATQNDLAATFVATCVDYYLQTGGKFGFVLPYAALRARHWAAFRNGDWSLRQDAEQGTHVDLSKDAWDFFSVNARPFPQANSAVVFGAKAPANRQRRSLKPLSGVLEAYGGGVNTRMAWDEVKPLLQWRRRGEYPVAPSPAYADEFRQGATLVPQSLVLFDEANAERALGMVRFHTEQGKGDWKGIDRDGRIEERFAKPALFSKHILPFGATGHLNIIAPFADDNSAVLRELPQGQGVQSFNLYWSEANADYIQIKKPKSPATLATRIDYVRNLSARMQKIDMPAVVYTQAGAWLASAVVPAGTVIDSTLYWLATGSEDEVHYLAAVFNALALAEFFHIAGRASDRHFHTGPIRNLPIPAYDGGNAHHANLAAQSQVAHRRVAALVSERQAAGRRINRNDVLRDAALQPILGRIDEAVRAILPAYSERAPDRAAPAAAVPLTASDYLAMADREFAAGNALPGAERLRDAVMLTLKTVAQDQGWPVPEDDLYPIVERLGAQNEQVSELLVSGFSSAEYYPDKVRYGYFDIADGDDVDALRIIRNYIDLLTSVTNGDGNG